MANLQIDGKYIGETKVDSKIEEEVKNILYRYGGGLLSIDEASREICQLFEQPPLPTDEQVTRLSDEEIKKILKTKMALEQCDPDVMPFLLITTGYRKTNLAS